MRPSDQQTRVLVLLAGCLLIAATVCIPFVYESMTMWYKVGSHRVLLRAAKIAGLLAALLLFAQLLSASRPPVLIRAFGLAKVMAFHRRNGIFTCLLALAHVCLVLAPEGFANLPIGKKHWPEMLGALLLITLTGNMVVSRYRERLQFPYQKWRTLHRPLGYSTLILLILHVRFVSDSFDHLLPQAGLFGLALLVIGRVLLSRERPR